MPLPDRNDRDFQKFVQSIRKDNMATTQVTIEQLRKMTNNFAKTTQDSYESLLHTLQSESDDADRRTNRVVRSNYAIRDVNRIMAFRAQSQVNELVQLRQLMDEGNRSFLEKVVFAIRGINPFGVEAQQIKAQKQDAKFQKENARISIASMKFERQSLLEVMKLNEMFGQNKMSQEEREREDRVRMERLFGKLGDDLTESEKFLLDDKSPFGVALLKFLGVAVAGGIVALITKITTGFDVTFITLSERWSRLLKPLRSGVTKLGAAFDASFNKTLDFLTRRFPGISGRLLEFISNMERKILPVLSKFVNTKISPIFSKIGAPFKSIKGVLSPLFAFEKSPVLDFIKKMGEKKIPAILNKTKLLFKAVSKFFLPLTIIMGAVESVIGGIKGIGLADENNVTGLVGGFVGTLGGLVEFLTFGMIDFKTLFENIAPPFQKIMDAIVLADFGMMAGGIWELITGAASTLWTGITNLFENLGKAGEWIADFLNLDIFFLKVELFAKNIWYGIIDGIKNMTTTVVGVYVTTFKAIGGVISSVVKGMYNSIVTGINGMLETTAAGTGLVGKRLGIADAIRGMKLETAEMSEEEKKSPAEIFLNEMLKGQADIAKTIAERNAKSDAKLDVLRDTITNEEFKRQQERLKKKQDLEEKREQERMSRDAKNSEVEDPTKYLFRGAQESAAERQFRGANENTEQRFEELKKRNDREIQFLKNFEEIFTSYTSQAVVLQKTIADQASKQTQNMMRFMRQQGQDMVSSSGSVIAPINYINNEATLIKENLLNNR